MFLPPPRPIPCFAAAAGAALLAVGCPAGPRELRIGVLAQTTGPYAEVSGRPTVEGARMAAWEARDVEVGGRRYRVVLVERDFADRPDAAATAARAAINQDQVVALIGPQFSRHAIPVSVLAEDAQVPMISPMSSNPATTAGKRYVFRLAVLDDVQGRVIARFARQDLRARAAATLFEVSSQYSRELAERFRRAFTEQGGRIVAFEPYTADRAAELGAQLRRIRAASPDVLYLPNFPADVARQVLGAQQLGVRATLLGSDSWDPPSLPPLRPAQAAYVTNQWRPDIPTAATRAFVTRYRRTFGTEPRAAAALTYDSVRILLAAVRRAGSLDPAEIRTAIAATREFPGVSGPITFHGGADPRRSVAVSRVGPGVFTTI